MKYNEVDNLDCTITQIMGERSSYLPSEWEISSIESVCIKKGLIRGPFGGALKKECFVKDGYKVYEQRNAIYQNSEMGNYYIDESKFNELKRFEISTGDFIVSCSGTIGKIFRIPCNAKRGVINQALLNIKIDENKITSEFFYQYFIWDDFQRKIIDKTQGGAMQNMVGMGELKKTIIYLAPLNEQQKIAEILSTWDNAVELREQLIEGKKKQRNGLMKKLLTGDMRVPGFDNEWEEVELSDISKINKGIQLNKVNMIKNGDFPAINGGISPSGYTNKWNTEGNTITISEGGNSCGFVNYVNEKFWCGGHCYAIFPDEERVDNDFLYQLLKHRESFIMRLRVGSGLPNIQKKAIDGLSIEIPSLDEQVAIANILKNIDFEIELLIQMLENIKLQKKGLMKLLLTGTVRVQ